MPFSYSSDYYKTTSIAKWNFEDLKLLNAEKAPSSYSKAEDIIAFVEENFEKIAYIPINEDFNSIVAIANKEAVEYNWVVRFAKIKGWEAHYKDGKTYRETIDEIRPKVKWLFVKGLQVHHTYYQKGLLPWEYPENSLQTYCWQCHEDLHKNEKVPYLDENGNVIGELTPCHRCYGAGELPEFNHIEAGICFHCWGARYEELIGQA